VQAARNDEPIPFNCVGDASRIGLDRAQVAVGLPSLRLAAGATAVRNMIVDAWLASANTRVGYPLDGLPSFQLDHDSWPLSDEGNFTTEKSFRLPWLRDDDAPAT